MYFSFHHSVKNHYCKIISFTDKLFFLDSKYFSQKNFKKTLRIYFFFGYSVKIFVTSHFIIIYFSLKVIKFLFRKLLSVMYMNFIWGMFVYCSPSLQYQTALKTINTLQVYESFSCLPSSLMRLRCSQSNKKIDHSWACTFHATFLQWSKCHQQEHLERMLYPVSTLFRDLKQLH